MTWRFDQVKYIAGRSLRFGKSAANYTVEGGLYYNLKPDIIKNRAEFLDLTTIKNFSFKYHGLTRIGEHWCYIVSFIQQAGKSLPHYSGYLYIDRATYGIAKAIYFPNLDLAPDRIAQMFVVKHPLNIIPKVADISYAIDYRIVDGKWHLNKTRSNVDIDFKTIGTEKSTRLSTISEYIVINANSTIEAGWNKHETSSKFDVLQQQIVSEDQYLWSSSKLNTEEEIEYTIASVIRDNPFIKSNLFDHRDYFVVPAMSLAESDSNQSTKEKDKVFLTKSNNITVYSSNSLFLGKKIDYQTISIHPDSLKYAVTDKLQTRSSASSAKEILAKVIQRIPVNYPSEKAMYTAYYREEVSLNNKPMNISDAIVNITKERYTHWRNDEIRLVSGRTYSPDKSYKKYNFVFQGGLTSNLQIDIVKYRASFIDPNYFEYYTYHYQGTDSLEQRKVFEIRFDQKDNIYYPFFCGTLYIDTESYAIVRADYGYSPKMMNMATNLLLVKSPEKTTLSLTGSFYSVSYMLTDSIWHLQHINGRNTFTIEDKRNHQHHPSEFTTHSEYLVTHLSPYADVIDNNKPIDNQTVLTQKVTSTEQLRNNIWQGLSIIQAGTIFERTKELFSTDLLSGEFQTVVLQ